QVHGGREFSVAGWVLSEGVNVARLRLSVAPCWDPTQAHPGATSTLSAAQGTGQLSTAAGIQLPTGARLGDLNLPQQAR
ncbi:Hypothetical predicted protein, partial [Marmota monax]